MNNIRVFTTTKMINYIDKERLDYFKEISKEFPNGRGVEVGVFHGVFSREILSSWNGTLFMIDPWRPLGDEYNDYTNQKNHANQGYTETAENIRGMEERGIMMRCLSNQATQFFPDGSLDFVYIDGNHAFDFVKEDINIWFPKVKPGGFLCGHDFLKVDWNSWESKHSNGVDIQVWSTEGEFLGDFGVNPAVQEFVERNGLSVEITSEWFGSWFIRKS